MSDLCVEKRAELRRLLDAATDGPWVREWDTSDQWWTIHGQPNPAKGDDRMVCPEVATLNHREDWTSDADLIVAAVNALPALLDAAEERDRLAAAIGRIQKLADDWHSRGEHLMAYSKTLPDEVSDALLESGAEFVERARLLRTALADSDGCVTTTEGDPTC